MAKSKDVVKQIEQVIAVYARMVSGESKDNFRSVILTL